ncbi:MAG: histidinol-phosphate transaminase [Pseudomonadota bacterium]|nr:histidinol-phosphate transaminase [Pseudomonadota bacterium]
MSKSIQLARPEVRNLEPYSAASYADGLIRLNANETPSAISSKNTNAMGLNRYPPEKPQALTRSLANFYNVEDSELLPTRGSSEAIDLIIRGFCQAGQDAIVICPPTFGMYKVYADIQGAKVYEVPLIEGNDFALDADELSRNWPQNAKLLFVCSPNNPTGGSISAEQLNLLATLLSGRAIVVVDAAYTEFSKEDPTYELLRSRDNDNILILRTLSKAFGLAGARCGALIGPADIITMLSCLMPPYSFSSPVIDIVMENLSADSLVNMQNRVKTIIAERDKLAEELKSITGIEKIYPSDANFLLVSSSDAQRLKNLAKKGGVLIRHFGEKLPGYLRITVGERSENEQLIRSLKES